MLKVLLVELHFSNELRTTSVLKYENYTYFKDKRMRYTDNAHLGSTGHD